MSEMPLCGPAYSVCCQVRPPSVVRYTPRSVLSRNGLPSAPTSATFGLRGLTSIREIEYECGSPSHFQCAPPSVVRQTPSPYDASLRGADSPVPTQTIVRMVRCNCNRSDRAHGRRRPYVNPLQAAVGRFENSSARRSKIIQERIVIGSCNRCDPPARNRRVRFAATTSRARARPQARERAACYSLITSM